MKLSLVTTLHFCQANLFFFLQKSYLESLTGLLLQDENHSLYLAWSQWPGLLVGGLGCPVGSPLVMLLRRLLS